MKILITGGAGFIGSHLAEYWNNQDAEVVVLDDLRSGYAKNISGFQNCTLIQGSITDKRLVASVCSGVDYIFNLAALVSVPESIINPTECLNINVAGLLNLLQSAKTNNVKKLVHTSSAAIYGDDPELPKKTSMKPFPKSPYGITKLDGEYYCNMYSETYGLKTTSLRYFNVFGPRQDPASQYAAAIPIFLRKALKNEDITIFGDGNQTRDFVFVKDVVQANILAAKSPINSGVFNVATGTSITVKSLAEKIIEFTGSKSNIRFEEERPGDIKHSSADISDTINQIGFSPKHSFENSLKQTISYFKEIL